ncbi:AAA family ATPase [Maribius pontilimi]|uniref:AAA family ATPase n=1 Tax=Palleronia pontilimi TaxID=1964209 RepID=A0A934IIS9_9RHOB|nr:bifunctional aminoglycoside phosphotransferase/ATP-binding protein [Palleronia pontilimi]MBJ3763691.1 AAA family ATPase [Palleronia pontilimi]
MDRTQDRPSRDSPPDDAQADVVRFLQGGAGLGAEARRIDTHGAMVFLIGDVALKMKRAVEYDYMDLSTVEKRRTLLMRELALNRRAAPSIYRDVVPVTRSRDGTLALNGGGRAVEWVLRMARFPAEAELSRIAAARGIDDALANDMGRAVARYHAAAPVISLDAVGLMRDILDELGRVFAEMGDALGPGALDWVARARRACADQRAVLRERTRQGSVRRCHGDLHLRNLVLIDDVPTPFDALEFDERLGTCDTLYDLAFLLMDLDHRGLGHAANRVLNAYLMDAAPDLSGAGLSLLPLYLSVRAAIRAMVEVQTAALAEGGATLRREARGHLGHALGYLDPPDPILVAFGGLSGTGKTTIAAALADRIGAAPGAIHIRSDILRKALLHRPILKPLGPEGYAADITGRTYDTLRMRAGQVLAQGHSVILDAMHATPDARHDAEGVARSAGCAFVGIWLDAGTQTRLDRIAARPPDASDADAELVRRQAEADPGPISWHRIDTRLPLDAVVDEISLLLAPRLGGLPTDQGAAHVG